MRKSNLHRILHVWAPRLIIICLAVFLATLFSAPVSKLFIGGAAGLGLVDSIGTMEELTGGRGFRWLRVTLMLVADVFAKAATWGATTTSQTWALYLQFVAVMILAEAAVIVALRGRLEDFSARRGLE